MEPLTVTFKNVSKRYPTKDAVKDLTFELPLGQVIGFIGPNGSGKSTTLRLMAGLLHPTQGEVRLNGQVVNRRASSQISYLSDDSAVYPFYTVGEMVNYYKGIFSDFDAHKAQEMLSFMNLDAAQNVRTLSKGNLGRLKIVLVVARTVPLIVMDEPLSGLDPLVRESIVKGLISFVDLTSQTVVMSTHEVDEIEPLLDVAVLMNEGRTVAMDSTENIRSRCGQNMVGWMKSVLGGADMKVQ
ncbi:ABC transporter ATP-binding protein [Alicyclobacillus tolerans]|uniref:ABC transporter ATP-binding protein n=1 Tax=Alicyclobacillus tolerans TaxID=90970 RepID=UPI001F2D139D|nr:ABC transporter ATP-binding protein [Alicyclobacillus tolerans]MCF8567916.1 ABC transporter ATP-binding protein [Alicyclobacillus tolerans]